VIMKALNLDIGALGVLSSVSKWARMLLRHGLVNHWRQDRPQEGSRVHDWHLGLWTAAAGLAQNYTQLLILYSIGVIGTVAAEPITNGLMVDMVRG